MVLYTKVKIVPAAVPAKLLARIKMTVKWARTFAVSHATNMAVLSLKDKELYLMFTSTISASAAITVPTPNALKIAPLVPCTKMQIQVLSL